MEGLKSFEVQENNGIYDVYFNAEPEGSGDCVFLFEGLSTEEYYKLIDVFTLVFPFRAEIPTEVGKLTYLRKKQLILKKKI